VLVRGARCLVRGAGARCVVRAVCLVLTIANCDNNQHGPNENLQFADLSGIIPRWSSSSHVPAPFPP
jgi:hypothetical protein